MSAVDAAVPDRRRRTRLALLALFVFAVGLRLAFYLWWRQLPGATWIDPDGYLAQGRLLGGRPGGWSWTPEAVRLLPAMRKRGILTTSCTAMQQSGRPEQHQTPRQCEGGRRL